MISQVSIVGSNQKDFTSPQGVVGQPLAVDSRGRLRVNVDYGSISSALTSLSASSPTFAGLTLSGLTASRLVATNASKALTSVASLTSWIGAGTGITVANDGDGTVTISSSSTAGGSDKQLQYNDGGSFGGATGLEWTKATGDLSLAPAGTLGITPTGVLTVNPTAASTINNCSIGATTASTGKFTTIQASSTLTLDPMTAGSVLFAGTAGVVSQDNASLFWDDTNNYLGIRTATPSAALTLKCVSAEEATTLVDVTPASWTLGAGWSGTNPFTHTPGSTETITANPTLWSTSYTCYLVDYAITGRTAGGVTLSWGGSSTFLYQTFGTPYGFVTNTSNGFTLTPSSDFDGTIQIVYIKKVTPQTSPQKFLDSSGNSIAELRAGLTTNNNFALGLNAGANFTYDPSYGYQNFAIGTSALQYCSKGYYNLALGFEAGQYLSVGDSNTFIGTRAGKGDVGDDVGRTRYSIGIGYQAMTLSVRSYAVTGIGTGCLAKLTDGYYVTCVGNNALGKMVNSSYVTAIGPSCLYECTGNGNTGVGADAGYNQAAGSNGVYIGYQSGYYHADGTTALTASSNSVYIGALSRGYNNSDSNTIAIGYQAIGLGANTTAIGNSSTTIARIWGDLGIGTSAPSAAIHSLKTTEQLRLGYDASNYMSVTVGSTGKATFNCVSGTAVDEFIFSDPIKLLNTGLRILDTNASHVLTIAPGSDLTADKTLTLTTGDADRTITLSGNPTLADWFDQSVKTTASPTFANITDSGLTASRLLVCDGSKVITSTQLMVTSNYIYETATDSDSQATIINYVGYNGGTTRYRDFQVCDGKSNILFEADGSSGNINCYNSAGTRGLQFRGSDRALVVTASSDAPALDVYNSHATTPHGLRVVFDVANPDNNTQTFALFFSSVDRCIIWSDGDIQNHDNSYGAISDIRLKTDIQDARGYLDDICKIRVRKWRFKDDVEKQGNTAPKLLGMVADEVEQIFPGLIKIDKRKGMDNLKGLKYSIFVPMLITCVQELSKQNKNLLARVEALEAR